MKKGKTPRVAIISDGHFPSSTTDTQQIIKNTAALISANLRADLIIAYTFSNMFRGRKKVTQKIKKFYNIKLNLSIRQIKIYPIMKTNLGKIIHGVIAPFFALIKGYPIIYTRSPLPAIIGFILRRRIIFESYRMLGDDYPKFMSWAAKKAKSKYFLGIIMHSDLAGKTIIKSGFPKEKVKTFHNGYDPNDITPRVSKMVAKKHIGIKTTTKTVVYTGNMQKNKGITSIIDIAVELPDVTFILVGKVRKFIFELQKYADNKNANNIIFTGFKPIGELSYYLQAADVLIIPPTEIPLKEYGRTVLPFKTFVYLATGRPILAGNLPDVSEVLKHNKNAILVKPDVPKIAANAIKKILSDKKKATALSKGALETAADLTWHERGKRITKWIITTYRKSKK